MKTITIATRASNLALWQAYYVQDKIEKEFPDIKVVLNKITSNGDKILDKPLALIGGKGHFTKELEDEMIKGNADIAVHSLKDVPTFMPEGLELVSITKRQDQSDVFLSHKYQSLEELPIGSIVGTTSLRRRMQLLEKRPDLIMHDLRGNVNTRLRKLQEGKYDAIVLAFIGLKRLDLLKEIPFWEKLSLGMMIPPMGQASLGIQIVSSNEMAREVATFLNDEDSFLCASIEREFISKIGAGCSAPVACNATISSDILSLRVMIGYSDGTHILHKTISKNKNSSKAMGAELATSMIKDGALELLKNAQHYAFKDNRPHRI
jgi:hydroxymethylbilane synthase